MTIEIGPKPVEDETEVSVEVEVPLGRAYRSQLFRQPSRARQQDKMVVSANPDGSLLIEPSTAGGQIVALGDPDDPAGSASSRCRRSSRPPSSRTAIEPASAA